MTPVFPSNTFPNHVSLVTGVLPEVHGIVSNVFKDPERGKFSYENDPTWLEAEPLWSFLARAGLPSAAYHWVGSEGLWNNGLGPTHWKPFQSGIAEQKKVDQILAWLDLPAGQVPRLITVWFRGADGAGHRQGPDSPQALSSLQAQDRALAQLVAEIEKRGLWPRITLLIVSDHGMAEVGAAVDVGKRLKQAGVQATLRGAGGFTIIETDEPQRAKAESVVRELGMELIWRPGVTRAPIDNVRFGSGVIVAPTGTAIERGHSLRGKQMKGAHGYWPDAPEMGAVFIAFGRGVSQGQRLGIISNLDVMPTILQLLQLEVPPSLSGRALFAGEAVPLGK
jgi:predicted AlkP superfamily pyrophosphatase or phosphodiesterase